MKTRYIKSILTLLMVWMVMPVMAQDYFTITFKDGREERHLLKLIKEITTSKYDADGVLHADYVSQKVEMQNTVYYYPLTDIESVSFQKVTEEDIVQNATSALSTLGAVLNSCESFSEICQHTDDISNDPGVEKVMIYDNSIVVRIKDWRDIIIMDIPDLATPPLASLPANAVPLTPRRAGQDTQNINHSVRVAIVNQNSMNDDRAWQTDFWQGLTDKFLALGYDADYIPAPSLDFFNRDIFSYDAVMLTTHGSYTENRHWFVTGEEVSDLTYINVIEGGIREWLKEKYYNSQYDMEDVTFMCIPEKRGNDKKSICYAACSEEYIRKSPLSFEHEDAIIFMNVCETLDGNDALADIFFEKGASILFGYTGTTGYGYDTGRQFYESLLNGNSVQKAFLKIPSDLKWENDYKNATLQLRQKKGTDLFLTKTVTAPASEVKDELREDGSHLITLYGYTTILDDESLNKGFLLSRYPDMSNIQTVEVTRAFTSVNNFNGNKQFEISLTLNPGETCYYQAYTFDDKNTNSGEVCYYTAEEAPPAPEKIMMLSKTVRDATYDIYKVITDKDNYRTNPDGWKCYKSSLVLDITKNGQTTTYTIDDNIYLDAQDSHHGGQRPCMYFHFDGDEMFIFINSKDTQYSYTMNGYAYRTSLSNISFNRETVFSGYNWGWSPYFTHEDDALALKHFSYAGYYAMTSYRNSNGTWSTQRGSYITPDEFDRQSEQAGDVFVADDNGSVANLQLSQTQVTLVEGNSCTVEITAGSGEYGVTNLGSDHAVATLQGTTITIVAVSAGDAQVVVTDMQSGQKVIIDIFVTASGDVQAYPSCPDGNHPHMIDLGLPSGVKWACCNIGADKPEKAGEYYAWGETSPQWYVHSGHYSMDSSGTSGLWFSMTKYCIDSAQGTVDNKISLDLADDVVHKKLGGTKRMPSMDEMNELLSQCQLEKTTVNGANVCKFTGPNGNSIFLPVTGYWSYGELEYTGNTGEYWSRSLDLVFNHKARILYFSDYDESQESSSERYKCKQVRAVMAPAVAGQTSLVDFKLSTAFNFQINIGESKTITILSGNGIYSAASKVEGLLTCAVNTSNIVVTGVSPGTTALTVTDKLSGQDIMLTVTVRPQAETPAEAIDLGLPSGTKWASHNIGATAPEAAGSYFAWGETGEKSAFSWENYLYGRDDMDVDDIGKDIAGTVYDVASQKWGGSWRLSTDAQMTELVQYCTTEWTTVGGVNCQKVTGPNGKFIILPAAGTYYGGKKDGTGVVGYYWASEPFPTGMYSYIYDGGLNLYIGDDGIGQSGFERYAGCTVRPVTK